MLEFGINEISNITFDIDNQDQLLADARKMAFNKASDKAKELANFNGVKIKRVITFSESPGSFPYPVYYGKAEALGVGGDLAVAPSIEEGSQEVIVNVSVTYEIQ